MNQAKNTSRPHRADPRLAGWICFGLAVLTFLSFAQAARFGFVNFDDDDYVYNNPIVQKGLTTKGLVYAFTDTSTSTWHPLTWLSLMLDCQLYGNRPGGLHLTSLLIHAASVIALFLTLRAMTGAAWRSAFAAAIFAIHPLRAESVVWIAERKDVLSALFFILTIAAYARFAPQPNGKRYAAVFLFFFLGLLSKPMGVTLPFVLLLLDFWPLRRHEKWGRLVGEKLPLLLVALCVCFLTMRTQSAAMHFGQHIPGIQRCENVMVSYAVYLRQMAWPVDLCVFYPFPAHGVSGSSCAVSATLAVAISIIAFQQRGRQPALLTGWLWYLITLLPVIGIVQVGSQAHADRYTYIPQIGVCIAVVWWLAKWQFMRIPAVLFIAVCAACSWHQVQFWADNETLWNRTLACTVDNEMAHDHLGAFLLKEGRYEEAAYHYACSVEINSNYKSEGGLASALTQLGQYEKAVVHFNRSLDLKEVPALRASLANALARQRKTGEAKREFDRALAEDPSLSQAHYNLANILLEIGQINDAIIHYEKALQLVPDYIEARVNLGAALLQKNDVAGAITQLEIAVTTNPHFLNAHLNLGKALLQAGRTNDATTEFNAAMRPPGAQEALKMRPPGSKLTP